MSTEEENAIEAAAAARRERLRALREAQELLQTPDDDGNKTKEEEDENDVQMKFRNYLPHDKQLQEGKVTPPDPFLNIVPKKPNWDLRRDVQKKLDKLEKRTMKALTQLMGLLAAVGTLLWQAIKCTTWMLLCELRELQ
uniref:Uncharacterized protein n=1 Tax=Solanum lycopersicum TaxID=4081 RepID=A0A3Q7GZ92_SOLLC